MSVPLSNASCAVADDVFPKLFDTFDYANIGDLNGDGEDEYTPPSGKKSKNGINSTPGVISAGNIEYKYTSGSSGQIEKTTENPGYTNYGRQSWLEIR